MNASDTRLQGAANFRDLGGLPTPDGRRLRHGQVFRSEVLDRLTGADLDILQGLSIGAVCDLRQAQERARRRNCWPPGAEPQSISESPAEGFEAVQTDEAARRVLAPDFEPAEGRAILIAAHRRMPAALARPLKEIFAHLLGEDPAPLLIHCTSGKDRSGFVCALLLSALGIERDAIYADYLLSAERYPKAQLKEALARGLGPQAPPGRLEMLIELVGVHQDYLGAAFDEIDGTYGGMARYLEQAAGLEPAAREVLQARLLR